VKDGDGHLLRRILAQGWRYRWMILLSTLGAGASGVLMAYLLTQLQPFIRYIGGAEAPASPDHLKQATDGLTSLGLTLMAMTPLAVVAAYVGLWAGLWVANRTMEDLRGRVLGHLVRLDIAFHQTLTRGELLTRLTTDLNSVLRLQRVLYGKLIQRPLESLGILGFVAWTDWRLAVVLIVILIPLVFVLTPLIRRTRQRSKKARQTQAENFGVLEQITAGIKVVKAMGSAEREHERYAGHNHKLFNDNMRLARSRAQSEAVTAAALFLISGLGMIGGAWLFVNEWIAPGILFLGIGALARLITAVREVVRVWGDIQEHLPCVARVFALLDQPSAIRERLDAKPCQVPREAIRLERVTFRYQPTAEAVLREVSLEIPVGRTVALVGPSGAGKSTLLDLLPRFHDVSEGRITIDGTDLRDVTLGSLSRLFAIVQQDNFLFNDTIYNNIAYGRPGATRDEVEHAARRAHIHDAILALEGGQGYDTVVGDRGSRLSGGQRQRVAIARALLRDAPILLMDEPTSALDADSERHVQEALTELMRGRTVVVVAHRLATVQHADRIYVMAGAMTRDGGEDPRRGTVVESGTHQELIARNGDYAELVRLQQLAG
jgi:ATP-binding cassette, subfamily B, bacterial MsbA